MDRERLVHVPLAILVALGACAQERDDTNGAFDGAGGGDGADDGGADDGGQDDGAGDEGGTDDGADGTSGDDGTEDGDDGGDGGTGDGGTTGGPIFDVGNGADVGGSPSEFCSGVDILFMIDDSPSMGPYQQALAQAFPGFIDTIYANLPEGDDVTLHVGITTSNFSNGPCLGTSVCVIEGPSNENYTPPGQGTVNANGAQGRLFEYDGRRFFEATTADDPTDLKAWFTAAASSVGEQGCNKEKQTAGFAYACDPINDPTNADFLRDEGAVLLLFAISDEADSSPESLATYKQKVIDAKAGCGGENCVIAAGIVNPCIEPEDNILWQFLNAFGEPATTGDFDDVGQYNQVIGDALAQVVIETCEEIPPEG
jgi:hypothetical protein